MSRRQDEQPRAVTGTRIHYVIPTELHRRAKAEAALKGLTLKDFVIAVLDDAVSSGAKTAGRSKPRRTT
jgi:predicted HicB family RNase H-like nuclease